MYKMKRAGKSWFNYQSSIVNFLILRICENHFPFRVKLYASNHFRTRTQNHLHGLMHKIILVMKSRFFQPGSV